MLIISLYNFRPQLVSRKWRKTFLPQISRIKAGPNPPVARDSPLSVTGNGHYRNSL